MSSTTDPTWIWVRRTTSWAESDCSSAPNNVDALAVESAWPVSRCRVPWPVSRSRIIDVASTPNRPDVPVTYPANETEMLSLLAIVLETVNHGLAHESHERGLHILARVVLEVANKRPGLIMDGSAFMTGFVAGFTWRAIGNELRHAET